MRPGVVFIAEEIDATFDGREPDRFFAGRFEGHLEQGDRVADSFEDLPLDEAIAWAREHADRIVLRIGHDDVYAIGFEPHDATPSPDGGVEPPVRRRLPEEAWKDRTDADPDARWTATIAVVPPPAPEGVLEERRRPEWDQVVEAFAAELAAPWSSETIDGWFADLRAAGEGGWATYFTRAYVVTLVVLGPTAARAREAAEGRLPALPAGWSAEVTVDYKGELREDD